MRSRSSIQPSNPPTESKPVESAPKPELAPEGPPRRRTRSSAVVEAATTPAAQPLEDKVAAREEADAERRRQQADQRRAEAPTQASELRLGGGHDRIVDALFELPDPFEVYERVKASLSFGGRASEASYGQLVDALDEAEESARAAFQLLVNAKVAHDLYEIDAKLILGTLRDQATAELQEQKAEGKRSKAITEADVEAVMAAKFPDEWRDLEARRGKARRMIQALEDLAERARERAKHLRQMVARARDA